MAEKKCTPLDALGALPPPPARDTSAQWPVKADPIYGCLLWQGKVDRDGYPRFRGKLAYRVAYEERHGLIPEGMEVEHICRRRTCMRDEHHELLTRSQQERRKRWRNRVSIARCPRGHDMFGALVTPEGGRVCRTCTKEQP